MSAHQEIGSVPKVTYAAPLPKQELMYSKRTIVSFSTSVKPTKHVTSPYAKGENLLKKGKKIEPLVERVTFNLQRKPSGLLNSLSAFLSDSVDVCSLLHETADILKMVTQASGVTLYIVDDTTNEIYLSPRNVISDQHKDSWKIEDGKTISQSVAFSKTYVMVEDINENQRFPDGTAYNGETAKAVLCVPIVTPTDDCYAVIELYRDDQLSPFDKNHVKILITVTGWMGAAIHQNEQRIALQKQQELNDYLLNITKCYFADPVDMGKMVSEYVNFAKTTLGAERGAFFVIDLNKEELVADMYDEGIVESDTLLHKKKLKVRFAKYKGVAGLVARTGVTINIKDAYNDPRFNKEIDLKTGFVTRSILCMPIMGIDGILGVIKVVNKINGPCFSSSDEMLFKTFSVYCALALHYSRLHIFMNKADKENKSYLKLLQYHMKPCKHDAVTHSSQLKLETIPAGFAEYDWYITPESIIIMPKLALHMITEVVGEENVHLAKMMQFILSVRKSYRNNPYHNFDHAFSVCHCIFNILKRNLDMFDDIEIKGMTLAALCHDLDHGGFNNNFLILTNDTLAQLYEESPLENHHYQVTMTILQDYDLFTNTSPNTFKRIAAEIKDAILSTDLSSYFKCRIKLLQVIHDNSFDWKNMHHRSLIKSIMMTTADLSGLCKPYPIVKKILDNLYREFYNQGDIEKNMGLTPLSMMDREKQANVPEDQMQFLSVVVMPCVDILQTIVPHTETLFYNCVTLYDTWKEIIETRGQKIWRQDDSLHVIKRTLE